MVELYGIPNCDTVKKARAWLDGHGVAYSFHDFKKEGLAAAQLDRWLAQVGWEVLLNRRGTTWRQLPDAVQASIDAASARKVMLENTSVIKRPVLLHAGKVHVGFTADDYSQAFG